eukprot:Gb_38756 [translate_table: standard]
MARVMSLRHRLFSASIPTFPSWTSLQISSQLNRSDEKDLDTQISRHGKPIQTPLSFIFLNAAESHFAVSHRGFSWWGYRANRQSDVVSIQGEEVASEMKAFASESLTDGQGLEQSFNGAGNAGETGIVLDNGSNGIEWYTPVDGVIAFLDGLHNLTALPWWLTIIVSTVAIRMALLPLTILQLKKMDRISEILPKLPPPLPMPGSGRSLRQQYTLFTQQRRAMGCPTFLWTFASFAVQAPCFISWMMAVRRMCVEHHPGFDCGGALWFIDLTEFVHGPLGALFPLSVAGMHFLNVQISFGRFKDAKLSGTMSLIQKYYKIWLEILTVPIFVAGFYIPQGSFMYWLTNGVLTATQQLSLRHPNIRQKFGLRVHAKESQLKPLSEPEYEKSMDEMSSDELLMLASQLVAKGNQDTAVRLLREAIKKDPEKSEAYVALGKVQLLQKSWTEAGEYFELAIAKGSNDDVLIAAYLGAGVALFAQGRKLEGIEHLRKLAAFDEPNEPWSKARYYQGLVTLGSALFQEGQKVEAAQFLRLAAKYDPSVNSYLRELEENPGH